MSNLTNMNTLHEYLICLGSNYEAITLLKEMQSAIGSYAVKSLWGPVLITSPEDTTESTPYHNRAALIYSTHNLKEVQAFFKHLEHTCGRTAESKSLGIIPMDIDILATDQQVNRPDDFHKIFVKRVLQSLLSESQINTLYSQV